jgi:hypothetical protein
MICGFDNPSDAGFCNSCGSKLGSKHPFKSITFGLNTIIKG